MGNNITTQYYLEFLFRVQKVERGLIKCREEAYWIFVVLHGALTGGVDLRRRGYTCINSCSKTKTTERIRQLFGL